MTAEIIPFDFEEQAVRVVMREGEPWFVAADVCRVLELGNTAQAVSRLDDDEKGVITSDTLGGAQRMTIISESGLYALVLTSRKPEAKRFRKWITAEVIPSIRRTGRYDHAPLAEAAPRGEGEIAGLPIREAELWLQMVREARLTRGTRAAVSIWDRSPLPALAPATGVAAPDPAEGAACLAHVLGFAPRGQAVADLARAALAGDIAAFRELSLIGLRPKPGAIFVANGRIDGLAALFAGTRWAGGQWRAALMAVPGARPDALTLAGVSVRGITLPCEACHV